MTGSLRRAKTEIRDGRVFICTGDHHRAHDCDWFEMTTQEVANLVHECGRLERRVDELEKTIRGTLEQLDQGHECAPDTWQDTAEELLLNALRLSDSEDQW